jgi:uncharacterized membrane protein YkvA (DUF1232 family)
LLFQFRRFPQWLESFFEKRPILCLVIVAVYIVSPFDILPEALLGPLGWFDDALLAIATVGLVKNLLKKRAKRRAESEADRPLPPPPPERKLPPPPPEPPRRSDDRPRRDDPRGQHRRRDRRPDRNRPRDGRRP